MQSCLLWDPTCKSSEQGKDFVLEVQSLCSDTCIALYEKKCDIHVRPMFEPFLKAGPAILTPKECHLQNT